MARPRSNVPSYRKHRSGQARVTINGRDYYLGPHGSKSSRREYDRLVSEYLASGRSGAFGATKDQITMAMLMRDYLRHAKDYYGTGPSSEVHRIKLAIKPIKEIYANLASVEFGPQQFKAVRQKLIAAGGARTTINAYMKRIVRMFKWAAAEGMLPASVHDTLKLIPSLRRGRTEARETDPIKPVPEGVVTATIKHLTPVVADMVRAQLLIGCRPGEICKLTPAMINRTEDVWIATLGEHKTAHHGHTRLLYIGPQAQAVLAPYLLRGPNDCLFTPVESMQAKRDRQREGRTTPLKYGNREGTNRKRSPKRKPNDQYTVSAYARAIKRAAEKANVEHWSPNQLRHTRGTEVRSQFGLDAAASILGHREVGVTQVYAEQDRNRAVEVARKIG